MFFGRKSYQLGQSPDDEEEAVFLALGETSGYVEDAMAGAAGAANESGRAVVQSKTVVVIIIEGEVAQEG